MALSEVLSISLSEVMRKYFNGSSDNEMAHRIGDDIDRQVSNEEGEAWLVEEAHRLDLECECDHRGGDNMF
jgi:hypothetical protein